MKTYAILPVLFLLFITVAASFADTATVRTTLLPTLGQKGDQWSFPLDAAPKDTFRLSIVDACMKDPWRVAEVVDSLSGALFDCPSPNILFSASVPLLDLSYQPRRLGSVPEVLKGTPDDWPRDLIRAVSLLGAVLSELEGSSVTADPSLLNDLLRGALPWPGETEASPCELAFHERQTDKRSKAALLAYDLQHTTTMIEAASLLLWGIEQSTRMLQELDADRFEDLGSAKSDYASGDLIFSKEYSWGLMLIGGPGETVYSTPAALIIDLGGDDLYRAPVGSGTGSTSYALCIDIAGNDFYACRDTAAVACGLGGVGILFDLQGDDVYEAGDLSLGAALAGVGVLVDFDGNDLYRGRSLTQGAAFLGLGLFLDMNGDDYCIAEFAAQGYAHVGGVGVAIDRSGNDSYHLRGPFTDILRYEDHALSMGQGFGFGYRPAYSGGVGLLLDGAGNDTYYADIFGQGASYWYALGGLVDVQGNDLYAAYQYVQGAGIHLASAALVDRAGNDAYIARGVSQGCGHDLATGILHDRSGDDGYLAYDLSQGAGSANGIGILEDLTGNDSYSVRRSANSQGYGNPRRHYGSLGFLWDRMGDDVFSAEPTTRVWQHGIWGIGWDDSAAIGVEEDGSLIPDTLTLSEALATCTGITQCEALFTVASRGEPRFGSAAAAAKESLLTHPDVCMSHLLAALASDRPRDRWTLENLFRRMGTTGTSALVRFLGTRQPHDAETATGTALWILGRIAEFEDDSLRTSIAVDTLLPLATSPERRVRSALAHVLAEAVDPAGLDALKTLAVDQEPSVRREAIRGFGPRTEKEALEILLASLQDEDPGVRHAAVSALAMREDSPSSVFSVTDSLAQLALLASIALFSDEDAHAICEHWSGNGASELVRAVASALSGKDIHGLADRPELKRLLSGLARVGSLQVK